MRGAVMEAQAGLLCARFGPGAYRRGAIHRYFLGLSSSASADEPAAAALAKLDHATMLLPDDPAAPYHSARILYLLQREEECARALEQALAVDSTFAPAIGLRQWLEEKRAATPAASRFTGGPLENADQRLWCEAYRSVAEGRWLAAAQAYAGLSRLATSTAEGYTGSREEILLGLGAARLEAEDHHGALEAFAIAEDAWPNSVTPGLFKAKVLYFLEQDERAEQTFRGLVEKSKGDQRIVEEILIFYYLYWDHEKVSNWLKDLPPGYSREIIEALLACEFASLGRRSDVSSWWQAAIDAAERASRYRPDVGLPHAIRGKALLRGPANVEAGEAAFARARELAPDDGVVLHFYGAALMRTPETLPRALAAFEAATRLSAWFPYAWAGIAESASLLGDHETCEAAYRRLFELDPMDWAGRVSYGVDLRRAGRYQDAEKELLKGVRSNPRSAFAWGWLGVHYAETYRGSEALEACERAMRLDAHDEIAHYSAAGILERLGRPSEAERRYRETVALGGRRRGESYRRLARIIACQGRLDDALSVVLEWLRNDPEAACKSDWLRDFILRYGLTERFLANASELEDTFRVSDDARKLRDTLVAASVQREPELGSAATGPEWPAGELDHLARGETLRINCGGDAVEPTPDEYWFADRFFARGQCSRNWVADVLDTDRDEVYRTARHAPVEESLFEYHIPLPPGEYRVRLHFAETWFYVAPFHGHGRGLDPLRSRGTTRGCARPADRRRGRGRGIEHSVRPGARGADDLRHRDPAQPVNAVTSSSGWFPSR